MVDKTRLHKNDFEIQGLNLKDRKTAQNKWFGIENLRKNYIFIC